MTWSKVVYAAESDEFGNCPVCGIDYSECPCFGPTQEDVDYKMIDGELYARASEDASEPMYPLMFESVIPTGDQVEKMEAMRAASAEYAAAILTHVPGGADQTYIIRKLREISMWANVAILREADGSARQAR